MPVERDLRTPAFETYLHRIGRSGRFGRKGAAFNLVTGESVSGLGLGGWGAGPCCWPLGLPLGLRCGSRHWAVGVAQYGGIRR